LRFRHALGLLPTTLQLSSTLCYHLCKSDAENVRMNYVTYECGVWFQNDDGLNAVQRCCWKFRCFVWRMQLCCSVGHSVCLRYQLILKLMVTTGHGQIVTLLHIRLSVSMYCLAVMTICMVFAQSPHRL
jgi:hypothetical protein